MGPRVFGMPICGACMADGGDVVFAAVLSTDKSLACCLCRTPCAVSVQVIGWSVNLICCIVQARADGGDEMDDLLSAPRMVLSQFVDKWFPDAEAETSAFPTSRLQKLLLDVSRGLALGGVRGSQHAACVHGLMLMLHARHLRWHVSVLDDQRGDGRLV